MNSAQDPLEVCFNTEMHLKQKKKQKNKKTKTQTHEALSKCTLIVNFSCDWQ